jgi:hypothetical protein
MFIAIIGTHLQDNVGHQKEGNSMKDTWFRVLKHLNVKEVMQVTLVKLLLNNQCIWNTYIWDAIVTKW